MIINEIESHFYYLIAKFLSFHFFTRLEQTIASPRECTSLFFHFQKSYLSKQYSNNI